MPKPMGRRQGFTLTELLVVIGIIVVLIGISAPMLMRAWRVGGDTAARADLQAISTALLAYKADFGDVPRLGRDWPRGNTNPVGLNQGAALLGWALVGPGQASAASSLDGFVPAGLSGGKSYKPGEWYRVGGDRYAMALTAGSNPDIVELHSDLIFDGHNGPGIGGLNGVQFGPYLQVSNRLRVGKPDEWAPVLLDANDVPILYYAASPRRPDLSRARQGDRARGYLSEPNDTARNNKTSLWDTNDNIGFFRWVTGDSDATAFARFSVMMGDLNSDGVIDSGEEAMASEGEFILWTAGVDGKFGPETVPANTDIPGRRKAVQDCDDITSFVTR